ncbi:MAG TPA: DMT family transporter [Firmicutes bacterium]|nr:DMT family transporter [Bacillota bacterium]
MTKHPLVIPGLVCAVTAASFAAILIRWCEAPAPIIATYRLAFAFMLTVPIYMMTKQISADRRAWRGFPDALLAVASGIFLALHFWAWVSSLNYTSVASAVMLVSAHPLIVYVLARLVLGESLSRRAALGGLVALLGTIVIAGCDLQIGGKALWGDLLALVGAVTMACYLVIGRQLRARLSVWGYTVIVYGVAAVVLATITFLSDIPFAPYATRNWLLFLALAVIPTLGGHTIFNWTLRYLQAATVSITTLAEPAGSIVLAWLLLGEPPGVLQILGGFLVIGGLVWFIRAQTEQSDPQLARPAQVGSGSKIE